MTAVLLKEDATQQLPAERTNALTEVDKHACMRAHKHNRILCLTENSRTMLSKGRGLAGFSMPHADLAATRASSLPYYRDDDFCPYSICRWICLKNLCQYNISSGIFSAAAWCISGLENKCPQWMKAEFELFFYFVEFLNLRLVMFLTKSLIYSLSVSCALFSFSGCLFVSCSLFRIFFFCLFGFFLGHWFVGCYDSDQVTTTLKDS